MFDIILYLAMSRYLCITAKLTASRGCASAACTKFPINVSDAIEMVGRDKISVGQDLHTMYYLSSTESCCDITGSQISASGSSQIM